MNVFSRELKAFRTSTIIWTISLSVMVLMFFMLLPAFTKDVEASKKLVTSLPIALRTALDISAQSFFTIYGFFSYLLTFITLAGAVQAMNLGVGAVAKEYSSKTVDFLLTKPISRFKVLTSKVTAMLCLILVTNLIFSTAALLSAKLVSSTSFDIKTFLLISSTLLAIQLVFLFLGVMIAVIVTKIKSVVAVSLPVVFLFFIIGTLGSVLGNDNVRYFSPFKFFDLNYIITHQAYEAKFLVIEAVLLIAMLVISYVVYTRKDIRSVS